MRSLRGHLWVLILTILLVQPFGSLRAEDIRYEQKIEDLAFGVALYDFYQDNTLEAITHIEKASQQDGLSNRPQDASLLLGGLYFEYGLEVDAERIFNNLLETNLDQLSRNRIWFSLARLHYSKNRFDQASDLIARIDAPLTPQLEAQKQYMLCSLHLNSGLFDEAISVAQNMDEDSIWLAYCRYNLGVAMLGEGKNQQGTRWLQSLAQQRSEDNELYALQDAANLVLGMYQLKQQNADEAARFFTQIQLSSSFSNQALLGTGWSWSLRNEPRKALAYWKALEKRQQSDEASYEVLLAMAQGVEQLGNFKLAIQFYQNAGVRYDGIINQMDDHIAGIEKGTLMNTLSRSQVVDDANYDILDETLKDLPATPFLQNLVADDQFQNVLKSYQELLYIRSSLTRWKDNLPALKLMLSERRKLFDAKSPQVEQATDFERLSELQMQRDRLAIRVNAIERGENYRALANDEELDHLLQLNTVKRAIDHLKNTRSASQYFPHLSGMKQWESIDVSGAEARHRILSGLMQWRLMTEFPRRFFELKRQLDQLNMAIQEASQSALSLLEEVQKNQQRLEDFNRRIDGQDQVIRGLRFKVDSLIELQQQRINELAIEAIEQRKQHLEQYRVRARYAIALLQDKLLREDR